MKTCVKCQTNFTIKRCPVCAKRYMAEYKAKNAEKYEASVAASLIRNRENRLARMVIYRQEKADKIRAEKAEYARKYPEKIAARGRSYRERNREHVNEQSRLRRARKLETGTLSQDIATRLYELQKGRCVCCGQGLDTGYHIDHIVPLSKGGLNVDLNVQLLRSSCNLRKHNMDPIKFMQEKGYLL